MSGEMDFEYFYQGQIFNSKRSYRVTAKDQEFWREVRPQPFHIDETAGKNSLFLKWSLRLRLADGCNCHAASSGIDQDRGWDDRRRRRRDGLDSSRTAR